MLKLSSPKVFLGVLLLALAALPAWAQARLDLAPLASLPDLSDLVVTGDKSYVTRWAQLLVDKLDAEAPLVAAGQ